MKTQPILYCYNRGIFWTYILLNNYLSDNSGNKITSKSIIKNKSKIKKS